jgi:ubiquinone/menaquinone biosynthesis C-methylase UbiE
LQQVDARQMPYDTENFDVIVSSLALHHIGENTSERNQAINEMLRVLKPGGTIALYDIAPVLDSCLRTLRQSGISDVQTTGRFFKLVIARKKID